MSIAKQLKSAIESSGKSQYQLAKEADISPIQLTRFLRGDRDLRLATADRLATVLGLSFSERPRRKAARS
jgi:transcriptional regulator with XRE-family HTH domain